MIHIISQFSSRDEKGISNLKWFCKQLEMIKDEILLKLFSDGNGISIRSNYGTNSNSCGTWCHFVSAPVTSFTTYSIECNFDTL